MFDLFVENDRGERLELSHNPNYIIKNITGLNPSKASINTSPVSTFDGVRLNSSRIGARNLVITLVIEGEIERNRINLYKYFKIKGQTKIYFKHESRDIYIEGVVESFETDLFDKKQAAQISLLCPDPFFKSVRDLVATFTSLTAEFYFEFAIEETGIPFSTVETAPTKIVSNDGDVETGLIIVLTASGEVVNPTVYNVDTREFLGVEITMKEADVIEINTNNGQKSITLTRRGVTTNIINMRKHGSTWLKLPAGDSSFTFDAFQQVDNLSCELHYDYKYLGV